MAKRYGVTMKHVLTGFKYIGGEILELEHQGKADRFVFGFEESCGYLKGTYARDKDAVVASMLVCERPASFKKEGKSVLTALEDLYKTYGYYLANVQSIELTGADAMEKAAAMMADLREKEPETIGGVAVTEVRDYRFRPGPEHQDRRDGDHPSAQVQRAGIPAGRPGQRHCPSLRHGAESEILLYRRGCHGSGGGAAARRHEGPDGPVKSKPWKNREQTVCSRFFSAPAA